MASIFASGVVPSFSVEQNRIRRAAWKPNKVRAATHENGPVIAVYRNPTAQAEYEARVQAKQDARDAKKAARAENGKKRK